MRFETPAGANPIYRQKVVGRAHDRIDGPLKTCGLAPYADEHARDVDPAYGYIVASAIGQGRIAAMRLDEAHAAPGVLAIVTARDAGTKRPPHRHGRRSRGEHALVGKRYLRGSAIYKG